MSDHILDLLFTNNSALLSSVRVTDSLPGCDDDAIQFTLLASLPKQSVTHRTLYNYKASNIIDLKEVLFHIPWNIIDFDSNDIELSWLQWKDLFSQLLIMWFLPFIGAGVSLSTGFLNPLSS